MTMSVKPEQVSITCDECEVTFSVDRADMTPAEWAAGAKGRAINDAVAVGWTGGRHSLMHFCPSCAEPDVESDG